MVLDVFPLTTMIPAGSVPLILAVFCTLALVNGEHDPKSVDYTDPDWALLARPLPFCDKAKSACGYTFISKTMKYCQEGVILTQTKCFQVTDWTPAKKGDPNCPDPTTCKQIVTPGQNLTGNIYAVECGPKLKQLPCCTEGACGAATAYTSGTKVRVLIAATIMIVWAFCCKRS